MFKLAGSAKPVGTLITSTPVDAAAGYAAGETIQMQVEFVEAVTVTGAPYLVLNVGGVARTGGVRFRHRHALSELRIHGAGSGFRFGRHLAVLETRLLDHGLRGVLPWDAGSISAQSDGLASELDLPGLGAQSGHKVDATPEVFTGSNPR